MLIDIHCVGLGLELGGSVNTIINTHFATNWDWLPPHGTGGGIWSKSGAASRQRDCHFAGAPSSTLLKRPLNGEGVQQNDSLAGG